MIIRSVLVVDDSEADQYLCERIVRKHDPTIEVLKAYDGQEALELLTKLPSQPDVIFLDINMPRMNGHEFLEAYNAWPDQSVVVVMLTSSDQEQDKTRSMAYRCVKKYCTKVLELQVLESVEQLTER